MIIKELPLNTPPHDDFFKFSEMRRLECWFITLGSESYENLRSFIYYQCVRKLGYKIKTKSSLDSENPGIKVWRIS